MRTPSSKGGLLGSLLKTATSTASERGRKGSGSSTSSARCVYACVCVVASACLCHARPTLPLCVRAVCTSSSLRGAYCCPTGNRHTHTAHTTPHTDPHA
jgi:hypothetical protein